MPWLSGEADIFAFRGMNSLPFGDSKLCNRGVQVCRFFTVPAKKTKPLSDPNLQEEAAGRAPPPVCSAAAEMKSERFQNSSSNKSRREGGRGDTPVGQLLLGYNMLRDDSVTRAGELWSVWSGLRDSSANCEALLRRIPWFFCLNQV